jgi:hypothetical protein
MPEDELEGKAISSQRRLESDSGSRGGISRRNRGSNSWLKWKRFALWMAICAVFVEAGTRGSREDVRMRFRIHFPPSDGKSKMHGPVPLAGQVRVCRLRWECLAVVGVVRFLAMRRSGAGTHRRV